MKFRIYNNIEDIFIFESNNESEFVEFVNRIRIENDDYESSIISSSDAKEYIEEYCDNLSLI